MSEPMQSDGIIKGVPIPDDVKVLDKVKKASYPWDKMDVGDLWEDDLKNPLDRNRIQTSLRMFQLKNPGKEFGYRLTKEHGTKDKGIEVWRLK